MEPSSKRMSGTPGIARLYVGLDIQGITGVAFVQHRWIEGVDPV